MKFSSFELESFLQTSQLLISPGRIFHTLYRWVVLSILRPFFPLIFASLPDYASSSNSSNICKPPFHAAGFVILRKKPYSSFSSVKCSTNQLLMLFFPFFSHHYFSFSLLRFITTVLYPPILNTKPRLSTIGRQQFPDPFIAFCIHSVFCLCFLLPSCHDCHLLLLLYFLFYRSSWLYISVLLMIFLWTTRNL